MKHLLLKTAAAAICAAVCLAAMPVAADGMMQMYLAGETDAVSADMLADGDYVLHGGMYIGNYIGLSNLQILLKSDDPLVIENGGFAWEDSSERQLRLFQKHDVTMYTQHSEETGLSNAAFFVVENSERGAVGELRDPESPLLEFDIRVPQNTPVGDYHCYISDHEEETSMGMINYDFRCIRSKLYLEPGRDIELLPFTFAVFNRGDVDCNGKIEAIDAQRTLAYYLEQNVMGAEITDTDFADITGTDKIHAAKHAMDVNDSGEIEATDAQKILQYYLDEMLGNPVSW